MDKKNLKTFINPKTGETVSVAEKAPRMFDEGPEFLQIFNSPAFKQAYEKTFPDLKGGEKVAVINRPGSVVFAREPEGDTYQRLILLRPRGFTADAPDELNAHPETRWAKIYVYGGVRKDSKRPLVLKKALRFCYYDAVDVKTMASTPYARRNASDPHYFEVEKEAWDDFYAVKEKNSFGFFHGLINQTAEWVMLGLEMQLLDRREPQFESKLAVFGEKERKSAANLVKLISLLGTETFDVAPDIVEETIALEPKKSLPLLIEALNLRDNGRHNPCTAFCVMLKIAKKHPEMVRSHVREALKARTAPNYYLNDLLQKLEKA